MKTLTFAVVLLLAVRVSWGKAGPEIPWPKQSVAEVVAVATKAFHSEMGLSQSELEWRKECFVVSVTYDTPDARARRVKKAVEAEKRNHDAEWSWFVTFVHPAACCLSQAIGTVFERGGLVNSPPSPVNGTGRIAALE